MAQANSEIKNEVNACGNNFRPQTLLEPGPIPEMLSRITNLKVEVAELKLKRERQSAALKEIDRRINLYTHPSEGNWKIKERMLEVYDGKAGRGIFDKAKIQKRNDTAHAGDVLFDMLLFEREGRTDKWILEDLYGVEYQKLLQVRESGNLQLMTAMNKYATINNRTEEDAPGSRLTGAIKSAYQSYLTVQFEDISADPNREGPTTPLFKKYYEFLFACGGA